MMYDPNNFEAMGPQVTARPGTKRHARQCAARRAFFNIMASSHTARAKEIEAQIDALTLLWTIIVPSQGNA